MEREEAFRPTSLFSFEPHHQHHTTNPSRLSMSSAAIFVPGAFGITLKRPKKQRTFQSPMKACRVPNCKQLYDPEIPANKMFYATLSYGQQDRRDHCPMHAAMAMDRDTTDRKSEESSISRGESASFPTKRTLGFGSGLKAGVSARQRPGMLSSPRSSISSSQNSIVSTSTAIKSSDNLLPTQPEVTRELAWKERPSRTTFGFGNIEDDIDG